MNMGLVLGVNIFMGILCLIFYFNQEKTIQIVSYFYQVQKIPLVRKMIRPIQRFGDYFFYENHYWVMAFYFVLMLGGFTMYYVFGLEQNQSYYHYYHKYFAFAFWQYSLYTYYLICTKDPGTINNKNKTQEIQRFKEYYDDVMYTKDNKCKTCKIPKPARSKHCSLCNQCVIKFDHHCIWMRSCIGLKNYKYFLSFIISHAAFTLYLGYLGTQMQENKKSLMNVIEHHGLFRIQYHIAGKVVETTNYVVFMYLLQHKKYFMFIWLICILLGMMLLLFSLYHLWLVSKNTSTNESYKIAQVKHNLQIYSQEKGNSDKENAKIHFQLERLKNWKSNGLIRNLIEIYSN